jgi:tripartite-type tricarboxylate transporter receptor subunit TctC
MKLKLRAVLAASALAFAIPYAHASSYPDRPIRVIVPYGPGGTDVQMRLAAPFMTKLLGQPIVVENRAGGGATIGTTLVRNSAPDGYTLLFTGTSALSVVPQMRTVSVNISAMCSGPHHLHARCLDLTESKVPPTSGSTMSTWAR